VLLPELACCRVGWDTVPRAARPDNIKALVRAVRPRVPPASVFAWRGELASHGLLRGSLRAGVAPRLRGPRLGRRQKLLVRMSRLSEARWRLLMRGRDYSCEAETARAWQRLVGEATP
jgi:hypothetical protein